jgi:hypothetical protein
VAYTCLQSARLLASGTVVSRSLQDCEQSCVFTHKFTWYLDIHKTDRTTEVRRSAASLLSLFATWCTMHVPDVAGNHKLRIFTSSTCTTRS